MKCPLVIIARSDAESGKYIDSNIDPHDHPFIMGRLKYLQAVRDPAVENEAGREIFLECTLPEAILELRKEMSHMSKPCVEFEKIEELYGSYDEMKDFMTSLPEREYTNDNLSYLQIIDLATVNHILYIFEWWQALRQYADPKRKSINNIPYDYEMMYYNFQTQSVFRGHSKIRGYYQNGRTFEKTVLRPCYVTNKNVPLMPLSNESSWDHDKEARYYVDKWRLTLREKSNGQRTTDSGSIFCFGGKKNRSNTSSWRTTYESRKTVDECDVEEHKGYDSNSPSYPSSQSHPAHHSACAKTRLYSRSFSTCRKKKRYDRTGSTFCFDNRPSRRTDTGRTGKNRRRSRLLLYIELLQSQLGRPRSQYQSSRSDFEFLLLVEL